jgi:hypothetical protein
VVRRRPRRARTLTALEQQEQRDREQLIRRSGPLIASDRLAGLLGQFRLTGPLLKASVYPAGLLVQPIFQRTHTILASEIVDVATRHVFPSRHVVIRHRSVDLASPLVLSGVRASQLLPAIEQLLTRAGGEAGLSTTLPEDPTARAMAGLALAGLVVSLGMAIIGVMLVIPATGAFGVVWTSVAVVAALVNLRRLVDYRATDP